MIALPVLAVTAADVVIPTPTSPARRRWTAGSARPTRWSSVTGASTTCQQGPTRTTAAAVAATASDPLPTAEQVSARARRRRGCSRSQQGPGRGPDRERAQARRDHRGRPGRPARRAGCSTSPGRLPRRSGEVVVNRGCSTRATRRVTPSSSPTDDAPADPTIVGLAESTPTATCPIAAGAPRRLRGRPGGTHLAGRRRAGHLGRRCAQLNAIGASCTSRAVIADPPPASELPAEISSSSTGRRHRRGARAGRGDGADRGGAAGRAGVRGRRPQAAAQPGPDGGDGRHAAAGAPGRPGRRRGARWRGRGRSASLLGIGVALGCCCRSSSASPATGSARSRCRGCTWPASPASGCSARSWPPWSRPASASPAGRRRGAGRAPRRPGAVPAVAAARPGAARCRHRRCRVRSRPGCRRGVRDRGRARSRRCSG